MRYSIEHLIPNATNDDFLLQDDGDGPYIADWNKKKLGNKPTKKALAKAAPLANKRAQVFSDIATLEASIDTPRRRREYAEGLRKQAAGVSPTADELATIKLVQDVDNQIGVLRAKLK